MTEPRGEFFAIRRLHPRLRRGVSESNFLHADAPVAFATAHLTPEGLGNHSVPEINTPSFAPIHAEGYDELLKTSYPILLLEHHVS